MSQPDVPKKARCPKLTIRNRVPGSVSTGANTIVELDGQPLRSVYFVKLDIHARRVARVTLELYAEVDVDVNIDELQKGEPKPTGLKVGDKHVALYQLSNYSPKVIATKK